MTEPIETARSDIVSNHWILRIAPALLRPYLKLARADRPMPIWLLLFPCWWSLSLAATNSSRWPDLWLGLLFAIGAALMRGAGCTYNDIVDRDYDAAVARTATRPIPSGQVSPRQAVLFLCLLLIAALIVLLQFNLFTIALAAGSLILVFVYPFMKRITYWPQAWLGLTFNWGALVGWAAITGGLDWPPILLYLSGIAWTLGYDTIYAHQDKEDDVLIGVKSTALRLEAATKPWLAVFYAATVVLLIALGMVMQLGWPFWLSTTAIAAQFIWQIVTLDINDAKDCLQKFKSNWHIGWILLAGIIASGQLAN